MHEYASMCSMKIHANLIVLQEEVSKLDSSNTNESAYAALSGLKQVSSIVIVHLFTDQIIPTLFLFQQIRDQLNPSFNYENVDGNIFKDKPNEPS